MTLSARQMARMGVRLGYPHEQVVSMLCEVYGYTPEDAEQMATQTERQEVASQN